MAATNPTLSDLHNRLDRLEQRISDIRSSDAVKVANLETGLSEFADRHLSIRNLIDESVTESALAKAHQQTSDLEEGIERWIEDVDAKFVNGVPRVQSVSM